MCLSCLGLALGFFYELVGDLSPTGRGCLHSGWISVSFFRDHSPLGKHTIFSLVRVCWTEFQREAVLRGGNKGINEKKRGA